MSTIAQYSHHHTIGMAQIELHAQAMEIDVPKFSAQNMARLNSQGAQGGSGAVTFLAVPGSGRAAGQARELGIGGGLMSVNQGAHVRRPVTPQAPPACPAVNASVGSSLSLPAEQSPPNAPRTPSSSPLVRHPSTKNLRRPCQTHRRNPPAILLRAAAAAVAPCLRFRALASLPWTIFNAVKTTLFKRPPLAAPLLLRLLRHGACGACSSGTRASRYALAVCVPDSVNRIPLSPAQLRSSFLPD